MQTYTVANLGILKAWICCINIKYPGVPLCLSYLLIDVDLEENIPITVAIVDLQHHPILCPIRAVMDVLDLLPGQLLQLKSAKRPVTVETGQPAVAGRFKDHNQDIGCVVEVVDLQDRLGDGCQGAAALHR